MFKFVFGAFSGFVVSTFLFERGLSTMYKEHGGFRILEDAYRAKYGIAANQNSGHVVTFPQPKTTNYFSK